MKKTKIAITLDEKFVENIDELVRKKVFKNRSQAIQKSVEEKLIKIQKTNLAKECIKLDPLYEKKFSEEGFITDMDKWPEY